MLRGCGVQLIPTPEKNWFETAEAAFNEVGASRQGQGAGERVLSGKHEQTDIDIHMCINH